MRLYRLLSRGLPNLAAKKCLHEARVRTIMLQSCDVENHEARGQNDHVTKLWRRKL